MSVKELRELLVQFEDDDEVDVRGGENEYGEWCELGIWHDNQYKVIVQG